MASLVDILVLPLWVAVVSVGLLAIVLLMAARGRTAGRRLALAAAAEALLLASYGFEAPNADAALAQGMVQIIVPYIFMPAYLAFLATVHVPLTRPFRSPIGLGIAVAICAAMILWVVLTPGMFVAGVPSDDPPGTFEAQDQALGLVDDVVGLPFFLYGLLVAIQAFRRAPHGSASRRQAAWYLAAFGWRDTLFPLLLIGGIAFGDGGGPLRLAVFAAGFPMATLGCVAMLTYGILRTHLFDLDLKIKVSLSRGTVVGIFIATFFVLGKVAEFYLSKEFGFVIGGVAAGLLLFAGPRLNKVGDKVASAAMPKVEPTPTYLAYRKLEVYRAAYESAIESGAITAKDRLMLDRLREKLLIPAADVALVERETDETYAQRAPAAPVPAAPPT